MNEKKVFYRNAVLYILQVVVIALLAWYVYQNRDPLILIKKIQWEFIVGIIVLDVASYLVTTFINYSMISRLNKNVTFLDSLMLQYVNSLLNKVLPTIGGGAAFRAYYLKEKYQFPYTQFVSTIAGLYIISFSTTSLIGILCLLAIYWEYHVFNGLIFLAFVGILIPTMTIAIWTIRIPDSNLRLLRIAKNIIDSWNIIKKERKLVFAYMFFTNLLLLISTAYTYLGYRALGEQPAFFPMLYLSTLGIILAFINFTPDGIGVKEGIYVFSDKLVQIPRDILVLGSLYVRGISMITTLLIGGISYLILMRQLKNTSNREISLAEKSKS